METPYSLYGQECGAGWNTLIEPVLALAKEQKAKVQQVKEKFGGLRLYIHGGNTALQEAIEKAENASYTICEECGAPGVTRGGGWLRTLCDTHGKERPIHQWRQ